MTSHQRFAFSLTALAAALLAAFGPARAEVADEVKKLITPESTVSLGVGYVDNENTQWGKYTGMTENQAYGLLDVHAVRRDDATGMWLRFDAWNLGLQDRELRFEQSVQGNWGYFIDFNQIPFSQPLNIITRTSGIGTPAQNPAGLATPVPFELDTRRDRWTVGFNKVLGKGFDFAVTYRNENKTGNRRWGSQSGTGGAGYTPVAYNFLAEPIDFDTKQLDAVVGYTGEKLQLLAGFYGTSFDNSNSRVTVTGLSAPNNVSLPPDNESYQGYLSGAYNFTPTTRGNFKVSYTKYTQNEAFYAAPAPPAGSAAIGRTSLDGQVETTLAEAGFISRPIPNLTLRADWRYEDRDDNTPRLQYISAAGSRDGFNVPLSRTTNIARAEAQYLMPMGFRLVGGIEYDQRERDITPTLRQISWREDTDEWSYRLEVSRSLSETLNGRLSYIYSDRDGSVYLPANNNADPDVIDPQHWADRKGDKWRLRLDWAPLDALAVQFTGDYADYTYDGRPLGPQSAQYRFLGLDATYSISDKWQIVGWVSEGKNDFNQFTIGSPATGAAISATTGPRQSWYAPQHYTSDAIGLGIRGMPTAKLEIGADVQFQQDEEEYDVAGFVSGNLALPKITTKHTTVTLFGKYAVSANSGVKVQYIYDYWSTDDWAWRINSFPTFNNGTLVYFDSPQQVNFIGASYYYTWQ